MDLAASVRDDRIPDHAAEQAAIQAATVFASARAARVREQCILVDIEESDDESILSEVDYSPDEVET
jgi:hypothetical protein